MAFRKRRWLAAICGPYHQHGLPHSKARCRRDLAWKLLETGAAPSTPPKTHRACFAADAADGAVSRRQGPSVRVKYGPG